MTNARQCDPADDDRDRQVRIQPREALVPPVSDGLEELRWAFRLSVRSCVLHQAEGLRVDAGGAVLVLDHVIDGDAAADVVPVSLRHDVGHDARCRRRQRQRPRQRHAEAFCGCASRSR